MPPQDLYEDEGIEWVRVDFKDNQLCLDLIEQVCASRLCHGSIPVLLAFGLSCCRIMMAADPVTETSLFRILVSATRTCALYSDPPG